MSRLFWGCRCLGGHVGWNSCSVMSCRLIQPPGLVCLSVKWVVGSVLAPRVVLRAQQGAHSQLPDAAAGLGASARHSGRGGWPDHRPPSICTWLCTERNPGRRSYFLESAPILRCKGDLRLPSCLLTEGQSGSIGITWDDERRCAAPSGEQHAPSRPPQPLPLSGPRPHPPGPTVLLPVTVPGPRPPAAHTEGPRGRCCPGSHPPPVGAWPLRIRL